MEGRREKGKEENLSLRTRNHQQFGFTVTCFILPAFYTFIYNSFPLYVCPLIS